MLMEQRLDGVYDKVATAIKRIQAFEPKEGYFLAFSGGKDSCVIKELANLSGVKYEAHYHITTVDPPELVGFIKQHHSDVLMDRPSETMWQLIARKKMPPTRVARYCCDVLKEGGGKGKVVMTGVRWAESAKRKNGHGVASGLSSDKSKRFVLNEDNDEARRTVEQCYRTQKTLVNPIVDWEDEDVWEFIKSRNLPYCELYDQGYERLGCIGCPLAGPEQMRKEFDKYPMYKRSYLRAFGKMVKNVPKGTGKYWDEESNPNDVMAWWLEEKELKIIDAKQTEIMWESQEGEQDE